MANEEIYDLEESLPDNVTFETLERSFDHHNDYKPRETIIRGTSNRRTLNPFKLFNYIKKTFNGWDEVQIERSNDWNNIFTAVIYLLQSCSK